MQNITRAFTEHPAAVGETWGQHATTAFGFALSLQIAALAALVHAILPFMFIKTASRIITGLHERMVTHRARGTQDSVASSDSLVIVTHRARGTQGRLDQHA